MELPEGSSSEADIKAALMGGVPGGRWKEGLLFEGIRPQPWLKSVSNWFPRTEDVQPNEMRIIFMGTAPFIRPGQMNTSIFVQLGNGENFVFDIREGVLPDYPNSRAPQFDLSGGKLVVPHPPTSRQEIQEPFVRKQEINPRDYYPRRYHPELLQEWPVEGDLVIPIEALPENLKRSMGEAARKKADNQKVLRGQTPD